MARTWISGWSFEVGLGSVIAILSVLSVITQQELFVVLTAGVVTATIFSYAMMWWHEKIVPQLPNWTVNAISIGIMILCVVGFVLIGMHTRGLL